jgi:hypothetical protein
MIDEIIEVIKFILLFKVLDIVKNIIKKDEK